MLTKQLFVIILGVAALFWGSCSSLSVCPGDDEGEAVLFPDPDDCGSFYECTHGVPKVINCPPGLYYNINLETCDYAASVDCGDRPTTTPSSSTPTTPITTTSTPTTPITTTSTATTSYPTSPTAPTTPSPITTPTSISTPSPITTPTSTPTPYQATPTPPTPYPTTLRPTTPPSPTTPAALPHP